MIRFDPIGDRAVLISLGNAISPDVHAAVRRAFQRIRHAHVAGVSDVVPGFASIAVHYEPALARGAGSRSPYGSIVEELEKVLDGDRLPDQPGRLVQIPVCYEGDFAPDLDSLAASHGLSADAVVALHTAPEYLVYMIGFLPGFPYLGGLDPRLATPRRTEPRTHVPAGSVGIGGEQTGVYPLESPGGWHLIGRTPLRLFTPGSDDPTLLAMGDRVRFRAVTAAAFRELESAAS